MIDYLSALWAPNATKSVLLKLDDVQRILDQAIISNFRTVAFYKTELEANLQSIQKRFYCHKLKTWVKLHSKPPNNRFWQIKKMSDLENKTWISPLQTTAFKF